MGGPSLGVTRTIRERTGKEVDPVPVADVLHGYMRDREIGEYGDPAFHELAVRLACAIAAGI